MVSITNTKFGAFLAERQLDAEAFVSWAMDVYDFTQKRGENPHDLFHKFVEHSNNVQVLIAETMRTAFKSAMDVNSLATAMVDAGMLDRIEAVVRTTNNPLLIGELQRLGVGWAEVKSGLSSMAVHVKGMEDKLGVVATDLQDHTQLYTNQGSCSKGKEAEKRYEYLLNVAFPEHEVSNVSGTPESMDLLLSKDDKPPIMIDVKFYQSVNVTKVAREKFLRDIQENKRHGILISSERGIANRKSFSWEMVENKYIALYLCKVQFNMDIVRAGVDLIYGLDEALKLTERERNSPLTPKMVQHMRTVLDGHMTKLADVKDMMDKVRRSMDGLMDVRSIVALLKSSLAGENLEVASQQKMNKHMCPVCHLEMSSKQRVAFHLENTHGTEHAKAREMAGYKK